MATIRTLINNATGNVVGPTLKLDPGFWAGGGSLPILISGITNATVSLEATIATDYEVDNLTAMWEQISGAAWTSDVADGLFTPFTHIRARVSGYVAGNIYVRTLV